MVRGSDPGTGISVEQISGTSPKPIALAEAAGKSLRISVVTVKKTEIRSSTVRALARIISDINSTTASFINPASSESI